MITEIGSPYHSLNINLNPPAISRNSPQKALDARFAKENNKNMSSEQVNPAPETSHEEIHPSFLGEQAGKENYQRLKENPTEARNPAKYLQELKTKLFTEGKQAQYVAGDSEEGKTKQALLAYPRGFIKAALKDGQWSLAFSAFEVAYGFNMSTKNEGKDLKVEQRGNMFWLDPETMARQADGLELQTMKRDLETIIRAAETDSGPENKYNAALQDIKIRLEKINEAIKKKNRAER